MNAGKKAAVKAKSKASKPKKPLRLAKNWIKEVPGLALKVFWLVLAVTVMGLLFSALQSVQASWIRLTLSALIIAGLLVMYFAEGLSHGTHDAQASRAYDKLVDKGITPSDKEDAACYHPLKALCGVMLVFIIPLLMALYLSATAKPYTYSLQDLPAWLTQTYGMREDIMAPLGAYVQNVSLTAVDWMRMFVRVLVMIFINFFSSPLKMTGLIDRLCPLLLLTYPAAYMLGYLRGPAMQTKQAKMNKRAKKVAVKKAAKKSLAEELTGAQNQVHYGQQAPSDKKHKKKELI